MGSNRIQNRFRKVSNEGRSALIAYVMGGDPDTTTSQAILNALPQAGADIIELGMAFSDPMADGPSIQRAGIRALAAGQTLTTIFDMVRQFRRLDIDTPIVLMGYFNPISQYGVESFLTDAKSVGVDGLIVVDLPSEEDDELCIPARNAGVDFIRLIPPNISDARLPTAFENASGFVYYVSMTGVTGAVISSRTRVNQAVGRLKLATDLPVAVGFGVKTVEDVSELAQVADAVVVGTVVVDAIEKSFIGGNASDRTIEKVLAVVSSLADGVRKGMELSLRAEGYP